MLRARESKAHFGCGLELTVSLLPYAQGLFKLDRAARCSPSAIEYAGRVASKYDYAHRSPPRQASLVLVALKLTDSFDWPTIMLAGHDRLFGAIEDLSLHLSLSKFPCARRYKLILIDILDQPR